MQGYHTKTEDTEAWITIQFVTWYIITSRMEWVSKEKSDHT